MNVKCTFRSITEWRPPPLTCERLLARPGEQPDDPQRSPGGFSTQRSVSTNPWCEALNDASGVPASLANSPADILLETIWRKSHLALVSAQVAGAASCNNVRLSSSAPILAGLKMLTGTLKKFGLVERDFVFRDEFTRVSQPHL